MPEPHAWAAALATELIEENGREMALVETSSSGGDSVFDPRGSATETLTAVIGVQVASRAIEIGRASCRERV